MSAEEQLAQLQNKLQELQSGGVMGVSVKLPPFWSDKPTTWFGQVEAQFQLAGITQDSTKYNHILASIDTQVADVVTDIIDKPPTQDKYNYLKTQLIKRLSASRKQKIRKLLTEEEIGDRKPSALLRYLRGLGATKEDDLLKELWMRRLPDNVRAILTAQVDVSLDTLADIADDILEGSAATVYAVNSPANELQKLTAQVEKLTKMVNDLTTGAGPSRSSRPNNNRSRSASPTKRCWYHRKYKGKANKCISPCDWKPTKNENSDQ